MHGIADATIDYFIQFNGMYNVSIIIVSVYI